VSEAALKGAERGGLSMTRREEKEEKGMIEGEEGS
jgi:hypothetical protein